MLKRIDYIAIRKKYFGESGQEARRQCSKYYKFKNTHKMITTSDECKACEPKTKNLFGKAKVKPTPAVSLGCTSTIMGINYNMYVIDDIPDNKEEENSMTDFYHERNYLINRVNNISWEKERELYDIFKMDADPSPKTYKELIDAIKNDKFKLDAKITKKVDCAVENNEFYLFGDAFNGIIWDGERADFEGYKAATRELNKRKQAALDVIETQDPAAGLKALQDFEAWMPEGKAN